MIVDSSALIAILADKEDAAELGQALLAGPARVPAPTLLEASIVAGRSRHADLDDILSGAQAEIEPFSAEHALVAREAYHRFGKGSRSRARLNFGDCIAYAVARVRAEPLLFKGDDFRHTDVVPAL